LPDCHARALAAGPILKGAFQNVLDLVFINTVLIDVWFASGRVDEEPKNHLVIVDPSSQGFDSIVTSNLLVDCEPARVRSLVALSPILATPRIDGDCNRNPTRRPASLRAKAIVKILRQIPDLRGYAQALARNYSAPPTA